MISLEKVYSHYQNTVGASGTADSIQNDMAFRDWMIGEGLSREGAADFACGIITPSVIRTFSYIDGMETEEVLTADTGNSVTDFSSKDDEGDIDPVEDDKDVNVDLEDDGGEEDPAEDEGEDEDDEDRQP